MTHQFNLKRNTVVCPKCGQRTTFNLIMDTIDEEGEFYRCQHCCWPFQYKYGNYKYIFKPN